MNSTVTSPKRPPRRRNWLALLSGALLLLPAAPAQARNENDSQAQLALRGIAMLDQRIAGLAHGLAVAGVDFCALQVPLPGFTLHHLSQYAGDYRDAAIQLFGLDQGPRVLALAADGPAERAGLRRNDLILAIDGRPLARNRAAEAGSTELIEAIQDQVAEGFADGSAELTIDRAGETSIIRVEAETGCPSRVHLEPSSDLNARADGKHVVVTTAISTIVRDDAELAAVLAHELAHNMLDHKTRLDAAAWRGKTVRQTEIEADRLSVHLLHRSGLDPHAAIRFWQHFGPRRQRLFSGSGHPGWRQRVSIMEEEIAEIRRQQQAGLSPRPDFLTD